MQDRFRLCPVCQRIVCLSCFDQQSDTCDEDSPRRQELAQAEAEQAGRVVKGFASALGLGGILQQAAAAAQQTQTAGLQADAELARCPDPDCGWTAPKGTKFCAQCGSRMVQPAPAARACPHCGKPIEGGKFCPHYGGRLEAAPPAVCPQCGQPAEGKFCANCGYRLS